MKRAPKKFLKDELYLPTILEMVEQFKTDAEIAKVFEARQDLRACDRFLTNCYIADIRQRNAIPSGYELRRRATENARAKRRRELDAQRKDLADRVAAALPLIDQYLDEGFGDMAISRVVNLNVYHVRNRRADLGLPPLNADKAPRDDEAAYRERLDHWDELFTEAIKATGRDFSASVKTKAFGRMARVNPSHVMTQSTAGSCADAA